jgi:hypothetical protein
VIDAQAVQDRCLEFVNVNRICGIDLENVPETFDSAPFDSAVCSNPT